MDRMDKIKAASELADVAMQMGLSLDDEQIGQFISYYEMLLEWNSRFNLTAITAWDDVLKKHFLDSLSPAPMFPADDSAPGGLRLADIGSGAGFPGIPLKIAFRSLSVTLIETTGKKADFLQCVTDELHLKDVTVINDRVEVIGRDDEHRGRYDLAATRAVSSLNVLCEYGVPLLKTGGELLCYKGPDVSVEVDQAQNAFEQLGCSLSGIYEPLIPDADFSRTIISIRKDADTPQRYPRRPGLVTRKPL